MKIPSNDDYKKAKEVIGNRIRLATKTPRSYFQRTKDITHGCFGADKYFGLIEELMKSERKLSNSQKKKIQEILPKFVYECTSSGLRYRKPRFEITKYRMNERFGKFLYPIVSGINTKLLIMYCTLGLIVLSLVLCVLSSFKLFPLYWSLSPIVLIAVFYLFRIFYPVIGAFALLFVSKNQVKLYMLVRKEFPIYGGAVKASMEKSHVVRSLGRWMYPTSKYLREEDYFDKSIDEKHKVGKKVVSLNGELSSLQHVNAYYVVHILKKAHIHIKPLDKAVRDKFDLTDENMAKFNLNDELKRLSS